MFLKVYQNGDKNDYTIYVSYIKTDNIKRIFYKMDDSHSLYSINIETEDKSKFIFMEDICKGEANYIVDKIIELIGNKTANNNQINLDNYIDYWERNSFTAYYIAGKITESDTELEIIEKILENTPEYMDNDISRLCGIAYKILDKTKKDIFLNIVERYQNILEDDAPDLVEYM